MATIQLLQGTEKIKDSYGKINTSLTNINNELTGHINTVTSHVSFLSANQYTAAEPVTSYPLGVSVMRVTDSDFPASNGNVITVKGTSGTGFQIFVSTANDDVGSAVRGTTGGNWKKWIPFEKAGRVLWSGNAYQAGTVLNLADNMNNYSFLIAVIDFVGFESRVINHKESTTYFFKSFNLIDDGVTPTLALVEMRLSQTNDTTLTIDHNLRWRWTGAPGDAATVTPNDSGFNIRKIIGVI